MSPDQGHLSLCAAGFERELAPGEAPEWVHLLPIGDIRGGDGRSYFLRDPGGIVRAFHAAAVDLPIDYEHRSEKKEALLNGPVPAAGWIKALEARETGVWARVEWTARARDMIAKREYRYISPTILYDARTRNIAGIKSAGLVHHPNLHLTALASQATAMEPDATILPQIIAALDLDPDTPPAEILSLLTRMKDVLAKVTKSEGIATEAQASVAELAEHLARPDPAKFVPIATVQAILAERNANLTTLSEDRAREKVAVATRKGYLSPAMQDWAISLCRSDEASFDAFVAKATPAFAHLTAESHLRGQPPGRDRTVTASAEVEAICAQLGIEPAKLAD